MNAYDDIDFLLANRDKIEAFENTHSATSKNLNGFSENKLGVN
jgi:hypothetical protein